MSNPNSGDTRAKRQAVTVDGIAGSNEINTTNTKEFIDLGMVAEKVTLLSTGNLAADVTLKIGEVTVGATINLVAGTPQTINPAHLVKGVSIVRTSGTGRVLILAK